MKLKELHIQNFKFFPKQDPKSPLLKIDERNLLIYGENGSGKSTIYWAIYTLLESSFKQKDFDVSKYFTKGGDYGLVNIHATKRFAPHIKAVLTDGVNTTDYLVSGDIADITNIRNNTHIRESGMASDFINYRVLFALHNVKNSKENNIFPWFEEEVLPYIRTGLDTFLETLEPLREGPQKVLSLSGDDIYPYAAMKDDPNPAIKKDYEFYKKFNIAFKKWNSNFRKFLKRTEKRANEILTDDFKQTFPLKLEFIPAKFMVSASDNKFDWSDPKIKIIIPKYQGKRNPIKKPHTFLNEAKWTAVGLSIRLAIIEDYTVRPASAELKCLVLDDMLLSLDMANREIVLNLLLNRYSEDFQLILLTHDAFFFEMAKAKTKEKEWMYLQMYEDSEKTISKPFITEAKTYLEKAIYYLKKHEFEMSGNFLRKEAESICKDFLPIRLQYNKNNERLDLSSSIDRCITFFNKNGFDVSKLEILNSHRDSVLNASSHDSYDVPKFRNELEACIKNIENIRKNKVAQILFEGDILEFELLMFGGRKTFKIEIHVYDEIKLIKENGSTSKITSGLTNYYSYVDGVKGRLNHTDKSLESIYLTYYNDSDKSKSANFWDEIILANGDKLSTIRKF